MRVVTTASAAGLAEHGWRWLEGRKHWPAGTELHWYTEDYELPAEGMTTKDFAALPEFSSWKAGLAGYRPPSWEFNVVGYAHKVFAAADALYEYDGIGVWCDSDCVLFRDLPPGLLEQQVEGAYLACYQRTGLWTETGFWVMDCRHPEHQAFLDNWRAWYLTGAYKGLRAWHDCMTLDATIRQFKDRVTVRNLSGEAHKEMHPMAVTELGRYIDHCKGERKVDGRSPENTFRDAA
jgi:hypothetical protein